jgi:hypothetical protein
MLQELARTRGVELSGRVTCVLYPYAGSSRCSRQYQRTNQDNPNDWLNGEITIRITIK